MSRKKKKCAKLENIDLDCLEDMESLSLSRESNLGNLEINDPQGDPNAVHAISVDHGEDELEGKSLRKQPFDDNNNHSGYYCHYCPKICKTKAALTNHLKIHQTSGFLQQDGEADKKCNQCDKVFQRTEKSSANSRLLSHQRKCKGGVKPSTVKTCYKCGKTFAYRYLYKRHTINCSPICPHCEKRFKTKMGIKVHLCPKSPFFE